MFFNRGIIERKILFFFVSFIVWVVSFILRVFLNDGDIINVNNLPHNFRTSNVISEITSHLMINDRAFAFQLLFLNNLKACLINILGGTTLGAITLGNLILNGFYSADVIVNIYNNGMPVNEILKYTLPHSIEFIAFWFSAAIGFYISTLVWGLMEEKDVITHNVLKFIAINISITLILILIAAYIEIYVSIP